MKESVVNESIYSKEEIQQIEKTVQDWLKKNKYNLEFSIKEDFKVHKALNSSYYTDDIIDGWACALSAEKDPSKFDRLMRQAVGILSEHPDWTLKELACYHESHIGPVDSYKYDTELFDTLMKKIEARYK